jgi:PilZ domain
MDTERRQSPRSKPYEPVYVSLNSENRGIVIDASENGLQFWTDAPVEHDGGALPLRFKLNPLDLIETVGEIIWIDESKKTGGVRFKNLPEPQRSNIRAWLEQNARPLPTRDASAAQAAIEPEPLQNFSSAPLQAPLTATPIEESADAAVVPEPGQKPPRVGLTAPGSEFSVPWRTAMPSGPATSGSRSGASRRVAGVLLIMLLMVVLVLVTVVGLGLVNRWQIGGTAQAIGQNILNWAKIGPDTSSEVSPADTNVSPLLKPPSKNHRIRPVVAESDLTLSAHPGPGDTELATALRYLRGDGGPTETNLAVKWLWASVDKGNANAAILLSDLYQWGRGVPQNCEQARVLLILAAKHGSMEAVQQLQDMESDGCSAENSSK